MYIKNTHLQYFTSEHITFIITLHTHFIFMFNITVVIIYFHCIVVSKGIPCAVIVNTGHKDALEAVSEALVTKYPQFKVTDCDSGTLPVCISTIL